MNPVMYLIRNPNVEMSPGKSDAQAAHAAVEAYKLPAHDWTRHCWDERGHHYAKVVLQSDDLLLAQKYIEDRGFKTALILDEGRTEFQVDLTPTYLGVQIVDKDNAHVNATFSTFKLFKPKPVKPQVVVIEGAMSQEQAGDIRRMLDQGWPPEKVADFLRDHRTGRPFITKLKESISAHRPGRNP